VNTSSSKERKKKPSISLFEKTLRYILFKMERKKEQNRRKNLEKSHHEYYLELFKNDFENINSGIATMEVEDINSKEVEEAIKKVNPKFDN